MITVQEELEKRVKKLRKDARGLVKLQKTLSTHCPELLAISAPGICILGDLIHFEDPGKLNRGLGAAILRISGLDRFSLRQGYGNIDLLVGGKKLTLALQRFRGTCKKARVTETRVIEVCGGINESRYDKVEYLD